MAMVTGQMGIHTGQETLVLGLDPGRDKTGFAVVGVDGEFLMAGIFPTFERDKFFDAEDFSKWLTEGVNTKIFVDNLRFIFIGNGTGSKEFLAYVQNKVKGCEIISVDEKNTTLEARQLYWNFHKPGLLTRLLPKSLRVPKRPLDDLAALSLTRRALKKYSIIFQTRNKDEKTREGDF